MAQEKTAKEIFHLAIEYYEPQQWEGYIVDACGADTAKQERVRELLNAHRQNDSFFDEKAAATDMPVTERPGMMIGPYKLLQEIGEGGFGVVYMAEQQEPVRRKVALKIIKPGMDTKQVIARFEAERQALAMMDHPNIAKVLDAGATESGRPYFVMELVKGVPITEFCDVNKLSTRRRLELFSTVCRAVQHAHQKGVIHRDLKPSNVMVTLHDNKPMPVIIDFGVSKAISHQLTEKTLFTAYGQMVGTPAYMSPEQAQMSRLDIDTRADVYSLGVVLYELLTGSTPLDPDELRGTAYAEMQRLIREEEAPKPSTRVSTLGNALAKIAEERGTDPNRLGQFLRGDLDWIVMKALEKDRSRRYETANGLADDIERFLSDEAVEACPPSLTYQLRKFIRRHRALVATASIVFVTALLGVIGTTAGMLMARRDARLTGEALAEVDEARKLAKELADEKQQEAKLAVEAKQEADRLKEEAQAQTAQQLMMRAAAERERGDFALAALLDVAALERDTDDLDRQQQHRQRIAADLRQCPRPTQLFFHDAVVTDACYSANGKWVATACDDGTVRIFDTETGAIRQQLQLAGWGVKVSFRANDERLLTLHNHIHESEQGRETQPVVTLWDWQSGKSLAETKSRVISFSASLAEAKSYTVPVDSHQIEVFSIEDGRSLGRKKWDWPVARFHTIKDGVVLAILQDPGRRRTGTAGRFGGRSGGRGSRGTASRSRGNIGRDQGAFRGRGRFNSRAAKAEIWHANSDRSVTLAEPNASGSSWKSAAVSPDGKLVAIGSARSLTIYDVDSAKVLRNVERDAVIVPVNGGFRSSDADIVPLQFSSDGQFVLCENGREQFVIDTDSGNVIQRTLTTRSLNLRIDQLPLLSPDSRRVLTLDAAGTPQLANLVEGSLTSSTPPDYDSAVRSYGFSPEARFVYLAYADGTVRIWDTFTLQLASPTLRHAGIVHKAEFSPDGSHLLVHDGSDVFLWPVGWPKRSRITLPCGQSNAFSRRQPAYISPDGRRVITLQSPSLSAPTQLHVWDAQTRELIHGPLSIDLSRRGTGVSFDADGRLALLNMKDGPPTILNLATGKLTNLETQARTDPQPRGGAGSAKMRGGALTVRTGGRIQLFSLETGKPLGPPLSSPRLGSVEPITKDGSRLAVLEKDSRRITIYDPKSGEPVAGPLQHSAPDVRQVVCSEDDRRLLSISQTVDQIQICQWDAKDGYKLRLQRDLAKEAGLVLLRFDASGNQFAYFQRPVPSVFRQARVRRAQLVVVVGRLDGDETIQLQHDLPVDRVSFSPDGRFVLTQSDDRVLRIWDSQSGELRHALESPTQPLESWISRDGRRVIAVCRPRIVQIWDLPTGQPLTGRARRVPFDNQLPPALFFGGGGGQDLVSADAERYLTFIDDQVVVNDLSADKRPNDVLLRAARALSGRHINQFGNVESLPPQVWRQEWDAAKDAIYEQIEKAPRGVEWHRIQVANSVNSVLDSQRLWHFNRLIKHGTGTGEDYYRRGRILGRQHRYRAAIADYNVAEKKGISVARFRASALARLGRWTEAAKDYEKSASLPPNSSRAAAPVNRLQKFFAGTAYLMANDGRNYERICNELLGEDPSRVSMSGVNRLGLALVVPRDRAYCEKIHVFYTKAQESPPTLQNRFRTRSPMERTMIGVKELLAFRLNDHETVVAMKPGKTDGAAARLQLLLLQAMSHHALGHADQAQDLLRRASEALRSLEPRADEPRAAWPREQISKLLYREAVEMIGTPSPAPSQ